MKFDETTIPQTFSVLEGGKGYTVDQQEVVLLTKTYIFGISDFLHLVETPAHPCALVIQDLKGGFVFGAIVSHNNETEEDEALNGNWNYVFTFDQADIPEDAVVYQISNAQVVDTISKRGFDICRLVFTEPGFCAELAIDLFNTIKNYLDQNAPAEEGEKFEIELDAAFEASVMIESGEKTFSILPKGEMKSLINDHGANDK